jgi:hypothetical protein
MIKEKGRGGCGPFAQRPLGIRIFNTTDQRDLLEQIERMRKRGTKELSKKTEEVERTPLILTIGHSTRPIEDFIDLLKTHGVKMIVDVRTVPRSRHNPHFNLETLPEALTSVKIGYEHMPGLGGLRHAWHDSPNMGWHNSSFRGFADYMQTEEFERSLKKLIGLARRKRICLMCAEAVAWRCHRSLIADALQVRGFPVEHIMSKMGRQPHKITSFARVDGTRITYPPEIGCNCSLSRSDDKPAT